MRDGCLSKYLTEITEIRSAFLYYCIILNGLMVPTERFELSTSPLPRECSTPELCGPIAVHARTDQAAVARCKYNGRQTATEALPEQAGYGMYRNMTEHKSLPPSKKVDQERQVRLARALRENLRRRKTRQTPASSAPSRPQKD